MNLVKAFANNDDLKIGIDSSFKPYPTLPSKGERRLRNEILFRKRLPFFVREGWGEFNWRLAVITNGLNHFIKKSHCPIAYRTVAFLMSMHLMLSLSGQSILSKKIDFETTNTPIADALIDLSEAADINIAFHPRLFKKDQNISIVLKNKDLEYILKQCLHNTNVAFKVEGEHLLLFQVPPKRYTISGYIEDAQTGERLIAANIWESHTSKGTTLSLIHISEPRDGLLSRMPSSA